MLENLTSMQQSLLLGAAVVVIVVWAFSAVWEYRAAIKQWFRKDTPLPLYNLEASGRLFADSELAEPGATAQIEQRVTDNYGRAIDERDLLKQQLKNLDDAINAVGAEFERRRQGSRSAEGDATVRGNASHRVQINA